MNARKEINKMLDAIDNEHSRDRRNWVKNFEDARKDLIQQQKAYNRQTHQLQQAEKKIANLKYEFKRVCDERDSSRANVAKLISKRRVGMPSIP